jgi:hypothetical protein
MESLASEIRRILLIRLQHDDAPGGADDNCEQLAALLVTCPAILALIRVRIETRFCASITASRPQWTPAAPGMQISPNSGEPFRIIRWRTSLLLSIFRSIALEQGDVVEIAFQGFGRALRNSIQFEPETRESTVVLPA